MYCTPSEGWVIKGEYSFVEIKSTGTKDYWIPSDVPNDKWKYMHWTSNRDHWRSIPTGDIIVNVTGTGMSFDNNTILYCKIDFHRIATQ